MLNAVSVAPPLVSNEVGSLLDQYRSRPKQLARWLLESRDTLREKYQELQIKSKRLKVRVGDLGESRDNWRQRADTSEQKLRAMAVEVERLTALLEESGRADSLKKVNRLPVR
jgi:predicted  nucleic acid-binding Zn-ribbon protein